MAVSIHDLKAFKEQGKRFTMLTAYDFPTAKILDEAGVPVLLVGDSLAQVVLGYDTTLPVTMEQMLHHTAAVSRAARNALVVADMPFGSYQTSIDEGCQNAVRFLKEGGAHAVKFEGPRFELAEALAGMGIPVMAHLGLTPQSIRAMGGYKVQARSDEDAERLAWDSQQLQKAGAFCLVLEGVPSTAARRVTESLNIPTIGIGAGPHCDGQVLVINDLLGLSPGPDPKFVKRYANLEQTITDAVQTFAEDVASGEFPAQQNSYE